jgi:hypothetical protein
MPDHQDHPASKTIMILAVMAGVAMASSVAGAAVFAPRAYSEAAAEQTRPPIAAQDAQAPSSAAGLPAGPQGLAAESAPTTAPIAAPAPAADDEVPLIPEPRALAATASVNPPVNASSGAAVGDEPLLQAASGAAEVAKSAGLKSAVTAAWRTAWDKSWPFIQSAIMKFFGLLGDAWKTILKTATNQANVNAAAPVNAPVNAAP